MPEKTYTLTELVTNLRKAADEGLITRQSEIIGLAVALGYELTDAGYEQFDADMTAAGL